MRISYKKMLLTTFILLSCYNSNILNSYAVSSDVLARPDYTIHNLQPLRFGRFVKSEYGVSDVSVNARDGVQRPGPGVTSLHGDYGAAVFEIRGVPGDEFTVYVPDTIAADGNAGDVRDMHVRPEGNITLDRRGRATFTVGGTLRLTQGYAGPVTTGFTVSIDKVNE